MEKHELSKTDFDMIDAALQALLKSNHDDAAVQKIVDLRDMFRDAYTGWLEIDQEAA